MQFLVVIVLLYGLLALLIMFSQRRLIYFPTRVSTATALRVAQEQGFVPWRNAADEIIGWHRPAAGPAMQNLLVVHGNGRNALERGYLTTPIHDAGSVDVFVLEYPGYGARAGSPSLRSFLAAAEAAFNLLPTNRPVYIVAESLGSGVATHLAKEHGSGVSGLLFFAPYNDLAAVGQAQMPIFPVKLLMRDRFKPAEWLKNYRGPVKVILAESDSIIPAAFGQKFYDGYAGPKSIEVIPGAGHNDIATQPTAWWKDVFSFWEQHRAR